MSETVTIYLHDLQGINLHHGPFVGVVPVVGDHLWMRVLNRDWKHRYDEEPDDGFPPEPDDLEYEFLRFIVTYRSIWINRPPAQRAMEKGLPFDTFTSSEIVLCVEPKPVAEAQPESPK